MQVTLKLPVLSYQTARCHVPDNRDPKNMCISTAYPPTPSITFTCLLVGFSVSTLPSGTHWTSECNRVRPGSLPTFHQKSHSYGLHLLAFHYCIKRQTHGFSCLPSLILRYGVTQFTDIYQTIRRHWLSQRDALLFKIFPNTIQVLAKTTIKDTVYRM